VLIDSVITVPWQEVSSGSMHLIGEAQLITLFNDGNKGTGTAEELAVHERTMLSVEGIVIAALDVIRPALQQRADEDYEFTPGEHRLRANVRLTTRGMWVDQGRLLQRLHQVRLSIELSRTRGREGGRHIFLEKIER
jgi:hypothetical protein